MGKLKAPVMLRDAYLAFREEATIIELPYLGNTKRVESLVPAVVNPYVMLNCRQVSTLSTTFLPHLYAVLASRGASDVLLTPTPYEEVHVEEGSKHGITVWMKPSQRN